MMHEALRRASGRVGGATGLIEAFTVPKSNKKYNGICGWFKVVPLFPRVHLTSLTQTSGFVPPHLNVAIPHDPARERQ